MKTGEGCLGHDQCCRTDEIGFSPFVLLIRPLHTSRVNRVGVGSGEETSDEVNREEERDLTRGDCSKMQSGEFGNQFGIQVRWNPSM
jgi:hypothetical protein